MRRIIIIITTLCLGLSSIGLAATANANQEEGSNGTPYDGTNGTISCSLFGSVTVTNNILSEGVQCAGTLEVPSGVTSIGPAAFAGAISLTSITLPSSVKTIGANTFVGATSLTSITLPTGVTSIGAGAFVGATSLTSITLPTSVTSIGTSAFSGATSLTSITIPKNVATIGAKAFDGATSLTSIIVDGDNTKYLSIEGVLFNKLATNLFAYPAAKSDTTYSVPEGVKIVGSFNGATALTSVTIPASVTSIGYQGFSRTKSLTSITVDSSNANYSSSAGVLFNKLATTLIAYPAAKSGTSYDVPAGVTSIDAGAFYGASSLTSITIPPSVTTLSESSFYGTTSLASITIPATVTQIGSSVFAGSKSLASITVDSSNAIYASSAGVLFNKLATTLLAYPAAKSGTSYALPSGVTTIDSNAFYGATLLTNVIIPTSVTTISDGAFAEATSLRNFYFLGVGPSLGGGAFKNVATNAKAYIKSGAGGFVPVGQFWDILVVDTYDYLVTYSSADGAIVDPVALNTGSAVQTAPTLAPRVGYTLAGWSATDGGSPVTFPYKPSVDTLLYAKWKKNPVAAVATVQPSITGKAIATPKGKNQLTANKGAWTGDPAPSFTYKWYACTAQIKSAATSVPKSCKIIAKATKPTLAVINSFKGKFIAVTVIGSVAGTTPTVALSKSTAKVK